ncbi:hypothetical protein DEIPH_ctg011orf0012 [Deinococcus phoenicis]|uniref:Tail tube protein n=1 Tax=Deinococcus phoenicis TaxID=1476583 RepID=A0A016QSP8_9DEIO|nr:hypothetical protein [Deinococcus phoenicis]EYB69048.1 hypothetical protein DEIPH_ctg011orf0012 [Deinococcus phoenicis]
MANRRPTAYVRRKGVRVLYAPEAAGAPGTFTTIKDHISGNVSINDTRQTQTLREFGTDYGDFDMTWAEGRSGTVSLTINMVPSDPGYDALHDAYEANSYGYLFIEALDELATPTGHTLKYAVQLSQFNVTLNMDNVAQVAVTFVIQGVATFTTPTVTP